VGGSEETGEAYTRPTRDSSSPPILSPVETRALPVHHDVEVVMGQHQEPSSASPRPGISTVFTCHILLANKNRVLSSVLQAILSSIHPQYEAG